MPLGSMATCRIDIQGQFGGAACNRDPLEMQQVMPAQLQGHMNEAAWVSFRTRMNQELQPISELKKMLVFANIGIAVVAVVIMIVPTVGACQPMPGEI